MGCSQYISNGEFRLARVQCSCIRSNKVSPILILVTMSLLTFRFIFQFKSQLLTTSSR